MRSLQGREDAPAAVSKFNLKITYAAPARYPPSSRRLYPRKNPVVPLQYIFHHPRSRLTRTQHSFAALLGGEKSTLSAVQYTTEASSAFISGGGKVRKVSTLDGGSDLADWLSLPHPHIQEVCQRYSYSGWQSSDGTCFRATLLGFSSTFPARCEIEGTVVAWPRRY